MCTAHSLSYLGSNCSLHFLSRHRTQYKGLCHVLIAPFISYYLLEGAVLMYSQGYGNYSNACLYCCYTKSYIASVEQVLAI